MANVGLGSLTTLKRHVLASALVLETRYDTQLTAIGLGVAGQIEGYCNRKLQYTADDTITFDAARDHFYLPRAPVASVSSVETKDDETTGWVTDSGQPIQIEESSGRIWFGGVYGTRSTLVRVTYTGGYWFDTSEDDSGSNTDSATELPGGIKLAWLLQCAETWNQKDRLGVGIVSQEQTKISIAKLDLAPTVKRLLAPYVRFQIS